MIVEVLLLIYLSIGFVMAVAASRGTNDVFEAPPISGYMNIMLFWLPLLLLAVGLALTSEELK